MQPPAIVVALNKLEHGGPSLYTGSEDGLMDELFLERPDTTAEVEHTNDLALTA